MLSLKIYSTHHRRPAFSACHGLFIPFWAGGEAIEDSSYIVDTGVPRKPTLGYNEMSQQYYVWKHLLSDDGHVGFEHYRRIFLFPGLFDDMAGLGSSFECALGLKPGQWHTFADEDVFDALLERRRDADAHRISALRTFVKNHDVIVSSPYRASSIRQQWIDCGNSPHLLDLLSACTSCTEAYKNSPFPISFDIDEVYFCNLFVMRNSIFRSYMSLWEQVMFALQGSIDFGTRMPSFLSERLFAVWVYHQIRRPGLRFAEVPFCLCEDRKVQHESW